MLCRKFGYYIAIELSGIINRISTTSLHFKVRKWNRYVFDDTDPSLFFIRLTGTKQSQDQSQLAMIAALDFQPVEPLQGMLQLLTTHATGLK